MPEIDQELLEKALGWCAEAGRQSTPAAARAALASLSWDQLLAARALLADPPPARPLGPFALADIARGAPADVAAERERAGRYAAATAEAAGAPTAPVAPAAPAKARGRKRVKPPFVVRRANERRAPSEPSLPALPPLDELLLEEGRAVLERLVRRHGGRRAHLLGALAAGWRRPDGQPPADGDLDRLLSHHGMDHAFALRERDELLHAVRAAGGVLAKASAEVGLARPALEDALARLGVAGEVERIREGRRQALRARGTLTQRTHLLLDETERLADLGLLEELSRDLAARLPDHLRALAAASADAPDELLGRSLALDPRGVERLLQHTGVRLDARPAAPAGRAGGTKAPPARHTRPGKPPAAGRAREGKRPPPGRKRPGARPPGPGRGPGRDGGGRRPPKR